MDRFPHWLGWGWRQRPWSSKFYISVGGKNQYSALSRFLVIEQQEISINDSFISKFRIVFAKIMYVPKKIILNLVLIYCFITTELEDLY